MLARTSTSTPARTASIARWMDYTSAVLIPNGPVLDPVRLNRPVTNSRDPPLAQQQIGLTDAAQIRVAADDWFVVDPGLVGPQLWFSSASQRARSRRRSARRLVRAHKLLSRERSCHGQGAGTRRSAARLLHLAEGRGKGRFSLGPSSEAWRAPDASGREPTRGTARA